MKNRSFEVIIKNGEEVFIAGIPPKENTNNLFNGDADAKL